jgi:2-polyprenyl-6-methoxyphenol hydroxylase-like FAD-dependent oxidoreductase
MSPIGGVGINLAIQDAVATANMLHEPLQHGAPSVSELHAVQRRRQFPTRVTQRMQVVMQNKIIYRTLRSGGTPSLPLFARLLLYFPLLRRLPGRMVGLGVRPEHVRSPDAFGR